VQKLIAILESLCGFYDKYFKKNKPRLDIVFVLILLLNLELKLLFCWHFVGKELVCECSHLSWQKSL